MGEYVLLSPSNRQADIRAGLQGESFRRCHPGLCSREPRLARLGQIHALPVAVHAELVLQVDVRHPVVLVMLHQMQQRQSHRVILGAVLEATQEAR